MRLSSNENAADKQVRLQVTLEPGLPQAVPPTNKTSPKGYACTQGPAGKTADKQVGPYLFARTPEIEGSVIYNYIYFAPELQLIYSDLWDYGFNSKKRQASL